MNKVEQRTTRDGLVSLRADAFRPLLEAVQRLDASLDRAAERAEDARRAKAEKRRKDRVDETVRNIYAEDERKRRQEEDDAFFERLTGSKRTHGPLGRIDYAGLYEVPE
jgi:hypothetical protein